MYAIIATGGKQYKVAEAKSTGDTSAQRSSLSRSG